jgi:putative membrane protein
LTAIASILPTAPATHGMIAALTTAGGFGAALAGLAVWSVLAFVATVIAVARKRTVAARDLLAPTPA